MTGTIMRVWLVNNLLQNILKKAAKLKKSMI